MREHAQRCKVIVHKAQRTGSRKWGLPFTRHRPTNPGGMVIMWEVPTWMCCSVSDMDLVNWNSGSMITWRPGCRNTGLPFCVPSPTKPGRTRMIFMAPWRMTSFVTRNRATDVFTHSSKCQPGVSTRMWPLFHSARATSPCQPRVHTTIGQWLCGHVAATQPGVPCGPGASSQSGTATQ